MVLTAVFIGLPMTLTSLMTLVGDFRAAIVSAQAVSPTS